MAETIESLRAVLERVNPDADGLVRSCARCGAQPVRLDADYEDDFWDEVVPEEYCRDVLCLDCVNHYALDNGIKVLPRLCIAYITTWDGTRPFVPVSTLATALSRLKEAEARIEALEKENRNHVERKHIDATPNDGYPLRILRAYRADCDMRWSLSTTNGGQDATPLMEKSNIMQDQRAAILDTAIAALARCPHPLGPDKQWRTDEPPDETVLVSLAQEDGGRVWVGAKQDEEWSDPEGFPLHVEAWMPFPAALARSPEEA